MSKHLVPVAKREVRKVDQPATELVEPAPKVGPFVSFQYSYTELSSVGGKTHVKSRKARLEDGKLVRESLDGELDPGVYEKAMSQASLQFVDQASLLLRALSAFLPLSRK